MKFTSHALTPKEEVVRYLKRLLDAAAAVPSIEGKSGAAVRFMAGLEIDSLRRRIQDYYDLVHQGES